MPKKSREVEDAIRQYRWGHITWDKLLTRVGVEDLPPDLPLPDENGKCPAKKGE